MRTKKHWILNYLRYHNGVSRRDIVRSCGLASVDNTLRDTRRMIDSNHIAKNESGGLYITEDGLAYRDYVRSAMFDEAVEWAEHRKKSYICSTTA
jgi:hypothetical protein